MILRRREFNVKFILLILKILRVSSTYFLLCAWNRTLNPYLKPKIVDIINITYHSMTQGKREWKLIK